MLIDYLIKLLESNDLDIIKFALVKIKNHIIDDLGNQIENSTEEFIKFKLIVEILISFLQTSRDKAIQVIT